MPKPIIIEPCPRCHNDDASQFTRTAYGVMCLVCGYNFYFRRPRR